MTKPIEMWMLRTEALRVSRNHIRAELKAKGEAAWLIGSLAAGSGKVQYR